MVDTTRGYAVERDREDPLATFRDAFCFPKQDNGEPFIYLCGNSLGLQPKRVREIVNEELDDWAELGVEGHFHGRRPWYGYHEMFAEPLAHIVGAKPNEVVVMGSLTNNVHLLMVSFYRPSGNRNKIVIESGAFPSDQYAVASQAVHHGLDPNDVVVALKPRDGEHTLRTEDILAKIETLGDSIATIMMGGVNYYTGQAYDFKAIAAAGHAVGATVGFDLAHAAGNLELNLHDDDVDYAAWCSYKYLNSGPGGVAGLYVHERHATNPEVPRFAGWWGNDPATRFEMTDTFVPMPAAASWQLSNAPVLSMAAHKASVDLFMEATMPALRKKSIAMTTYLLDLIDTLGETAFEIITPRAIEARGSQLSIRAKNDPEALFKRLQDAGVICDFRKPDVVRIAAAPLYNSFEDLHRFWEILAN